MPRFGPQPPASDPSSDSLASELAAARQQVARLASERSRLMSALSSARNRIVALERVAQSREQQTQDTLQLEQDHAREMAVARGVIETLERQCERADARAKAYRSDLEQERQKSAALRRQAAELAGKRRRSTKTNTAAPPSLERHQRPTVELAPVH